MDKSCIECDYCKSDIFAHDDAIKHEIDRMLGMYTYASVESFFESEHAHRLGSLIHIDGVAYKYLHEKYDNIAKIYTVDGYMRNYVHIKKQFIHEYNCMFYDKHKVDDKDKWLVCNMVCDRCKRTACPFHTKYGSFEVIEGRYLCGWCKPCPLLMKLISKNYNKNNK
jgi:hypothetical protein